MGNPIIDRARAHYQAHGTQSIEVPEWGEDGQPLIVYWTPVTMSERQRVVSRAADGKSADAMAHAVILKAMDAQGKPMFSIEDKHALMNLVDSSVVERLANALMGTVSVEDMEKN